MFDSIEILVNDLFERHIDSYSENLTKSISWTLPEAYKPLRRDLDRVVQSYENCYESDATYVKDVILECVFLLNNNGVEIYLNKIKERLEYQSAETEREVIINAFIKGRKIQPASERVFTIMGVTHSIPTYSFEHLDFDIHSYTTKLVDIRIKYQAKLLEIIEELKLKNVNGKLSKDEDIFIAKPTLWGLSIDLNKFWRRYIKRKA